MQRPTERHCREDVPPLIAYFDPLIMRFRGWQIAHNHPGVINSMVPRGRKISVINAQRI